MTDAHERKDILRKAVLAKRDAVSPDERMYRSTLACRKLFEAMDDALSDASVIAVYASMGSEVNLAPFIRQAYGRGWRIAFPCMIKRFVDEPVNKSVAQDTHGRQVMNFRFVSHAAYESNGIEFLAHPLETYEPADPALDAYPPCIPKEMDAVVVPLVAFDASYHRLGYGGGNYDRFLPDLRTDACITGIAFDEQQVDTVPTEPHDQPLPHIVVA